MKTILRKIIRKSGFDIVRYKESVFSSQYKSKLKWDEIINTTEAGRALKSVNREPLPYFEPFKRPYESSQMMDDMENKWWNEAGSIMDVLWGFPEDICKHYRQEYVKNAERFFMQNRTETTVLELGCGNGWLGKMIAGNGIEYIGTDFSKTQIELANKNLIGAANSSSISYYCLDDFSKLAELQKVEAVIINTFLHHLYGKELDELFDSVRNHLPVGCKIFVTEPVYYSDNENQHTESKKVTDLIITNTAVLIEDVKKQMIEEGSYDLEQHERVTELMNESNRNGFFFSPKEVPFQMEEIMQLLNKYCTVHDVYPCGFMDIEAAQILALIKDDKRREQYAQAIFPLVKGVDNYLINTKTLETCTDSYIFTCFECSFKPK